MPGAEHHFASTLRWTGADRGPIRDYEGYSREYVVEMEGKPPLRGGMSAVVSIDTGHARGLPDFVTDLLKRFGQKS